MRVIAYDCDPSYNNTFKTFVQIKQSLMGTVIHLFI